jgi:hypothetical protein
MRRFLRFSALVLGISSISVAFTQSVHFTESHASMGVFHNIGPGHFGSGVSTYDFDQDGWADLTLASVDGDSMYFYRNLGDGTFEALPDLVSNIRLVKQVLWADYDNDGDPDLYLASYDGANRLYQNDGSLNFTEVTPFCGIPHDSDKNSYHACFADVDRDGDLDFYQGNYGLVGSTGYSRYYENIGSGLFVDRTVDIGLGDSSTLSLAAGFADLDNDMWPDFYEANDKFDENRLWRNVSGTLQEVTGIAGDANVVMDAMCVAYGDYNKDGYLDVYITNTPTAGGNVLLRNNGDFTFTDVTAFAGVGFWGIGWGSQWFDADNDGDEDLYTSGMTVGTIVPSSAFYLNRSDGSFDWPDYVGLDGDTVEAFSNAIADFNRDGKVDFVCANNAPATTHVWINDGTDYGNYISVQLQGIVSNKAGVGSWVKAYAGGELFQRFTTCGIGYLSQNSQYCHLGLGANETLDSLVVYWPSGEVDRLYDVCVNDRILVEEGMTSSPEPLAAFASLEEICDGDTLWFDLSEFDQWSWSDGYADALRPVTSAGTYNAQVSNVWNVCRERSIEVIVSPNPEVSGFATSPDNGSGNGSATVGVSGGTGPYTFSWNDPANQNAQTAIGLSEGTYEVVVTDSKGCSVTASVIIERITGWAELENNWNIYPQPADQFLQINSEQDLNADSWISLFDLSGKEIMRFQASEIGESGQYRLSAPEQSGSYLLQIEDAEGPILRQMVIFAD